MAMEYTWEFWVAVVLGVIALLIVAIFIFLLLNPPRDKFDLVRRPAGRLPKGPVVQNKGPPRGPPRGPPPRGPPRR